MDEAINDPYNPETYGPPGHGSVMGDWMRQDAFMDQWRLLAQHVAAGGDVSSATFPPLDRYDPRFRRDTAEGIQAARHDAQALLDQGLYDAHEILDNFRQEDEVERQNRELRAQVYGGEFSWPDGQARLHTTITRLFTDAKVHDVCGFPYEPWHLESTTISIPGSLTLLGLRDIETGIQHHGEMRLDAVNADSTGPGSGTLVIRLVWGDPSTIVGAVAAGKISGPNRWIGVGLPGASQIMVDESHRVLYQEGRFRKVASEIHGESVWFWSSDGDPWDVFVAVDAQREPVGLIFDSSGICNYYWLEVDPDDEDGDSYIQNDSDWPEDAREFDPTTDTEWINPNRPA